MKTLWEELGYTHKLVIYVVLWGGNTLTASQLARSKRLNRLRAMQFIITIFGAIIWFKFIPTRVSSGPKSQSIFEKLDIPRWADQKLIKDTERQLTKKYHPDKYEDSEKAREILNDLKQDIEIIKNPIKRQIYDKFGYDKESLYDLKEFEIEKFEDGLQDRSTGTLLSHMMEIFPFLIMCLFHGIFHPLQFKGLFAINIIFSLF